MVPGLAHQVLHHFYRPIDYLPIGPCYVVLVWIYIYRCRKDTGEHGWRTPAFTMTLFSLGLLRLPFSSKNQCQSLSDTVAELGLYDYGFEPGLSDSFILGGDQVQLYRFRQHGKEICDSVQRTSYAYHLHLNEPFLHEKKSVDWQSY